MTKDVVMKIGDKVMISGSRDQMAVKAGWAANMARYIGALPVRMVGASVLVSVRNGVVEMFSSVGAKVR